MIPIRRRRKVVKPLGRLLYAVRGSNFLARQVFTANRSSGDLAIRKHKSRSVIGGMRAHMDKRLKKKILDLLDQHRIMTVATNRLDCRPQATTVGYVNIGLTLYFLCGLESQKAENIARDKRISLTIDHDVSDPLAITGLSMAAEAQTVKSGAEMSKVFSLFSTKCPEYGASRSQELDISSYFGSSRR